MEATGTTTSGVKTTFEPRRMVGITLFLFAIAGGMFLSKLVEVGMARLNWNDVELVEGLFVSNLVGFGLAAGGAVYCWMSASIRASSLEIASELKRVTWPTFAETRVSTVAVIIASVVSAAILFVFDFVSSKVMTVWVPQALAWLAKL